MGRSRYAQEQRERAVRIVFEQQDEHDSQWLGDQIDRIQVRHLDRGASQVGAPRTFCQ